MKLLSLQDHFTPSNLTDFRAHAFQSALACPSQSRDRLWLESLARSAGRTAGSPDSILVPKGWERYDQSIEDAPAYKNEKSVFYWLHRTFYHAAFVFRVPAGASITLDLPVFPSEVWPLLILEVGSGATVTVLDELVVASSDHTPFRGIWVRAQDHVNVQWKGYQHNEASSTFFDHQYFTLGEASKLNFYHHEIGKGNTYRELLVQLDGLRSEVFSQILFFAHGNQQQEMRATHLHRGQHTVSHMVSKGAVQDHAHSRFLGYIQMEPGCSGADGQLQEHNLLLSSNAKIDAVPGLEIGHHDVAAGHSASMERVDSDKLFYLASRGIPKTEAIELIVEGFFLDALKKMNDPQLARVIFEAIKTYLS